MLKQIFATLEFSLYSEFSLHRKIFAIIANFRYVVKILFVAKFSSLVVLCINDPVLVNFISTLVISFVLVCFCNFPCFEHYISSVKFL